MFHDSLSLLYKSSLISIFLSCKKLCRCFMYPRRLTRFTSFTTINSRTFLITRFLLTFLLMILVPYLFSTTISWSKLRLQRVKFCKPLYYAVINKKSNSMIYSSPIHLWRQSIIKSRNTTNFIKVLSDGKWAFTVFPSFRILG